VLLEAGGRDWNPLIHMPVGFTKLTSPSVNWGFETVPQRQLDNRTMWYPQGRTLGGSTSINAMIYIRGQREDYDRWAALGNDDWGYEQVLPFFRRAERNERLNDEFHGTDGAMNVTEQIQHNELSMTPTSHASLSNTASPRDAPWSVATAARPTRASSISTPASSCARPPSRAGATTPPGPAGRAGPFTGSAPPTATRAIAASSTPPPPAPTSAANAPATPWFHPTTGRNPTRRFPTKAPPPRSPPTRSGSSPASSKTTSRPATTPTMPWRSWPASHRTVLAADDPDWEGVLKHGTYHETKQLGVDESVMWGDYWLLDTVGTIEQSGSAR
jgi:hypothetical protein